MVHSSRAAGLTSRFLAGCWLAVNISGHRGPPQHQLAPQRVLEHVVFGLSTLAGQEAPKKEVRLGAAKCQLIIPSGKQETKLMQQHKGHAGYNEASGPVCVSGDRLAFVSGEAAQVLLPTSDTDDEASLVDSYKMGACQQ